MKNYVKEYSGYKVPEGATHWFGGKFAKWINNEAIGVIGCFQGATWRKCSRGMPRQAIELPEAPQEWNGEGLPPVGTVCECFVWTNFAGGEKRWVPLPVVGHSKTSRSETHKGKVGIVIDSCECDGKFIFCDEFRPLKTQQEKDREAFVERVKQLLPKSDTDDLILSGKLFDLGFTAPKASDNE